MPTLPESDSDGNETAQLVLSRLRRLGITGWHEPLLCLPKSYLDFSCVKPLRDIVSAGGVVAGYHVVPLVVTERARAFTTPTKRLVFAATDGMLSVRLVVFEHQGPAAPWKKLAVGDRIHVAGAVQNWNGRLQIANPTRVKSVAVGHVVPVYEKKQGVVADGAIFEATRLALENSLAETARHIVDSFGGLTALDILSKAKLKAPSIETILRAAHSPASMEEGMRGLAAMRRLAALSIVESARRLKQRTPLPESVVEIPVSLIEELIGLLPYPLTKDQRTVVNEIVADMAAPVPMRRVLSGDVGSGKTLPIMIIALAIQRLARRAVVLTPNALLAEQFVKECSVLFGLSAGVQSVTAGTKKLNLSGNPILVGTTALLTRLQGEAPPAFLAVDEEQKMSVGQKAELTGASSNYLQATATPIPRTTALITHGAMDVSIIREMPVVKNIATHIVSAAERKWLFDCNRKIITSGGQVAVVYPIVNDAEQEKKSVVAAAAEWERQFPGLVGVLHGQMKEDEKVAAAVRLRSGDHRIAIVSSVIEIGLTLPSLRALTVVHAERYGTSTLHQLRGRVARLGGDGHFFMYLPGEVSEETRKRLDLLVQHADGFTLSEKDAELRGYGDLFEDAERQSGNSRSTVFRCVDLSPQEVHAATKLFGGSAHPN